MPFLRYPTKQAPMNLVVELERRGFDINKPVWHYQNDDDEAWLQGSEPKADMSRLRFVGIRMFCKPKQVVA